MECVNLLCHLHPHIKEFIGLLVEEGIVTDRPEERGKETGKRRFGGSRVKEERRRGIQANVAQAGGPAGPAPGLRSS